MKSNELRALQAPLKQKYKDDPQSALITLKARGQIGDGVTCRIETGKTLVEAGLHPATGGNGLAACSGDMLLEALAACAGVTLKNDSEIKISYSSKHDGNKHKNWNDATKQTISRGDG